MTGSPKRSWREPQRILVCDDERHIVRLIQVNLERQGHRVTSAYGGREAIELLSQQEFDVAVLDPHMPEVNGYDVRDWIVAHDETMHMEVIMLDGKAQDTELRLR
jgi:two-component system alkaline phosphatase synthesis response regulator PhoP/two-component system response regulator VicR